MCVLLHQHYCFMVMTTNINNATSYDTSNSNNTQEPNEEYNVNQTDSQQQIRI